MQIIIKFFFLMLLMMGVASGQSDEEDSLIVPLSTGVKLTPVTINPFNLMDSSIPQEEVLELEKVLNFDLDVNGMTYVEKNQRRKSGYTLNISICQRRVHTQLISEEENWTKEISGIPIFGDINKDRIQMHLIADTIHKMLFGKEGIARTKIVYTVRQKIQGKHDWICEVWQADYDGANAKQVLVDEGYCVTPQYLPPPINKKASHFFYVSYKTGQPKIYIGSLKKGESQRFSLLKGNQFMPTLSRQRDMVAFISDVTGNPDLFVQPFSPEQGLIGKPRQIFSAKQATQGTPTFSPDGKKIAFVSNKDGSPRIYVIAIPPEGAKLKDIKVTLLTKYRRGCTAPAWSPDGKKIAYCAPIDGVKQIFVYDLKSNKETQLTQGILEKENPSWAPNSLHLVYNASNGVTSDLYFINLNHPEPIKIALGYGEKRFPSWEPE